MPSAPRARREYDAATKAAVIAALLEGQSVSAVARQYRLPKGTVSAWKQRTAAGVAAGVASAATQKADAGAADQTSNGVPGAEKIGGLLIELLESNIRGLISMSRVLRDAEWVRQQGAAELGTLMGITHDKVVRMLEAMDRSANPSSSDER